MATPKKIINQGAIAAAQAQNTAAAQTKAAAESRAAAALEKGRPILTQAISGTAKLAAAVNAQIAALSNPGGIYDPIAGRVVKTSAQLKSEADAAKAAATGINKYGGLTPEQIELSKVYGKERTDALAEAAGVTFVDVPGAVYEEEITKNLSEEAFINTLKLLMGAAEASKPYVKQLYSIVSKYYKSGSTIPDSINLALYDAKENKLIPEFTNRFSGIFKLADRRAAGEVIDVPTLAEYVKSQEAISEVLRKSNLGDLANETFLNEVMGTGKSVLESTRIIADVFDAIDNAPKEWSDMVKAKMPFATRTDLGKALLLGAEGAADLERKVNRYGIMAAAQSQGLTVGEAAAGEFLAKGQGYASAKPKFGQAAAILPTAQKLTSMETGIEPAKAYTQEQAFSAVFDQNYQSLQNIQNLSEREQARFGGRAGRLASRDRAAGQI
jgi:hypothetical protein